tara:strand:+ start:971 stop:1123 length:153 start_codon:yes stop_codon:yes gene_type:complete
MIFHFDSNLLITAIGIYLCGVACGVSGLALFTLWYVGQGNKIIISHEEKM